MTCLWQSLILSPSSALAEMSCSFSARNTRKFRSSASPACLSRLDSIWGREHEQLCQCLLNLTFGVFLSIAFLIQMASASWASSFSLFLLSMIHLLSSLSASTRPRPSSVEARRPARPLHVKIVTKHQEIMTITLSNSWLSQTRPHRVWTFLLPRQKLGAWICSQCPSPWHYWGLFYNRWRTDDPSRVLISPSFFPLEKKCFFFELTFLISQRVIITCFISRSEIIGILGAPPPDLHQPPPPRPSARCHQYTHNLTTNQEEICWLIHENIWGP